MVPHPLARESLFQIQELDPVRRARQERGHGGRMVDAHSSINPYGGAYARYPAGNGEDVRAAYVAYLAAETQARGGDPGPLTPDHVLLTPGSAAALELVFRAFLDAARGDRIGIASPAFPLYAHAARLAGLGVVEVPLHHPELDTFDVDALVRAAPRVSFLCSPNNPTGLCLTQPLIRAMLERSSGIVVIDEAYIEFAAQPSAIALVCEFPNLIVTRTFSKAWGLAGVRVGAVIASPAVVRTLGLVQLPFAVSQAAELALRDKLAEPARMLETVAVLNGSKHRLARRLAELPIIQRVHPSDANFLLVEVARADEVYDQLRRHGILVNHTGWALPDTLRISLGTEADCEQLVAGFQQIALELVS